MRTFIIEEEEVEINEEEIASYSLIYDDVFYQEGGREVQYFGELYFNESGEIFNRQDNRIPVAEVLTYEDGELVEFNKDFFNMECTEGFLLNNKLYLIAELEELFNE